MFVGRNDRATVFMGSLPGDVDEDLLFELAVQFGKVRKVTIPRDRLTGVADDFAFIEFDTPQDAEYMAAVCEASGLELYGKRVRIAYKGTEDGQGVAEGLLEIGARLSVRNLEPSVTEDVLYQHFSQFGTLAVPPVLMRDSNGASRGVGFVSFDSFTASDAALAATNGQFFRNKRLHVDYAERADGNGKHGSVEERRHFAEAKAHVAADSGPLPSAAPSWAAGLDPHSSAAARL